MHRYVLGFLFFFGMAAVQSASADTLQNCVTCGGVVYTLTDAPVGAPSGGLQWYDFTLQVNTAHITAPNANLLRAVALGVPAGTNNFRVDGTPLSGGWTSTSGGISNGNNAPAGGGCNGSGNFQCLQSTGGVPTGSAGDIYTFIFGYQLSAGLTGDLASGLSLKAIYDSTPGTFGGLQTSDKFAAPVPEPGTLTLLGAGLLAAGLLLKRR